MSSSQTINISISENSHAFLEESVNKAITASSELRDWQFAILHLVQSLELSLKSMLHSVNPILIYDNIDSPKHTVSVRKAIIRLENSHILGGIFANKEKDNIEKAIELRNQITHSDFSFTEQYAIAKFFETFSFVVHFQAVHLNYEVEDIVGKVAFDELMLIYNRRKELLNKANERIANEEIDESEILCCPDCGEFTFIIKDEIETCYHCRHHENLVHCPQCEDSIFQVDLINFEDLLSTYYDEGRTIIHNDYGYKDYNCCESCLEGVKEHIVQERDQEEYYHWMEEEQHRASQYENQ